jgi:hypothetical protein
MFILSLFLTVAFSAIPLYLRDREADREIQEILNDANEILEVTVNNSKVAIESLNDRDFYPIRSGYHRCFERYFKGDDKVFELVYIAKEYDPNASSG